MLAEFDPVALDLGFFVIHWYGLAYLVGFVGALSWSKFVLRRWAVQQNHHGIVTVDLDEVLTLVIIGVLVGGRLGEVLLYHPQYYLSQPWEIFKIWQGGMSFHGGVAGVVVALYWFSWRKNCSLRAVGDMVCLGAPIGIFLGRIANFINGELWGRPTEVPWAVIVPQSGSLELRHPSPLYEATLEGLLLFLLLALAAKKGALRHAGMIAGMFLSGYAVARFGVEFFRAQEVWQDQLWWGTSWGQWLSVPLLLAGAMLIVYSLRVPFQGHKRR